MEQVGAVFEGEWPLSGMYSTSEESEFMIQLLGEFSPPSELHENCQGLFGVQSNLWPGRIGVNVASRIDDDSFVDSSDPSSSICFSSQENSTYSYSSNDGDGDMTNFLISSSHGSYYHLEDSNPSFATNNTSHYCNLLDLVFEEENVSSSAYVCTDLMMQLDDGSDQPKTNTEAEGSEYLFKSGAYYKAKPEIQVSYDAFGEKGASPPADSKKRPRNGEGQKNKRNVKPRKTKKVAEVTNVDEDKTVCGFHRQNSNSICSKDDASAPSEISGGEISCSTSEGTTPLTGNGKIRANRGSATDPQSLYARKRREKINERLKVLQGLVPNGTKVDISTMLDEAVKYVKFLQLQIKLLSSDDLWMYAPLAYNGMDIGLDMKL